MAAGSLTRRIGLVAVGRAAGTLSIFAVNAILARAWPEAEVGLFRAVWVLGNTLVPIFLLGLPTSLLYFFPRRSGASRGALIRHTALCLLGSGGVLAALLYFLGPQLAIWLDIQAGMESLDLGACLRPFLPYVFSLVAGGYVEAVLVAAGRPHWQAGLALATAAGLVGGAAAGAALGLEAPQVLLVFSALGLLRLLVALVLVGQAVDLFGGGRSGLGEYLKYTLPNGLNDAVGSLSRSVDRFVVLFFFQAGIFARYDLGAIEVPVSLLLAAVVTVLVPEVSRLYQEGELEAIAGLWKRAVTRLALVVLPLFFFLFAFADMVIAVYLPAEYTGTTTWVFRIFLLALPLRCAVYNPLLVGMGRARWALWGGLGDLFLNLFLSIVIVQILLVKQPEWAFLGPAVATVFSTYAQVLFLVGLIGWHLKWGIARLLPWASLLRLSAVSGGAALVALAVAGLVSAAGPRLCLGGAVFALVLGGMVWLNPQDREELEHIFRGLLRS